MFQIIPCLVHYLLSMTSHTVQNLRDPSLKKKKRRSKMLITVPKSNPVAVNGPLHTFMVLKHTQILRRKNPTLVWYLGGLSSFSFLLIVGSMTRPSNSVLVKPFIWKKIKLCFHSIYFIKWTLLYKMSLASELNTCCCPKSSCRQQNLHRSRPLLLQRHCNRASHRSLRKFKGFFLQKPSVIEVNTTVPQ